MAECQGGVVLRFEGELCVQRAAEMKEEVVQALAGTGRLLLDLSAARGFDPSFLQVLCAARRTARERGQEVALGDDLPDGFQELVAAAGFGRTASCPGGCMWAGAPENIQEVRTEDL